MMKRIIGRLNVKDLIGNYQKALKENRIKEAKECTTKSYWINGLDGKKYLFKSYANNSQMYRSLLVEKIAKTANIKTCTTDIATFGYLDGELIEDYRREGFLYTSGSKILAEYYMYIKTKNNIEYQELFPKQKFYKYSTDEILLKMNNIYTIKNALYYHFKDSSKKELIVENIIKNLKQYFCLDIITMQEDRGHHNWEIEETVEQEEAYLAPYSDMNSSFQNLSFPVLLNPFPNSLGTNYQKLAQALEDDGYEIYYELYEKNPISQIEYDLKEIEEEKTFHIEKNIYNEIVTLYKVHYENLTELIERTKGNTRK